MSELTKIAEKQQPARRRSKLEPYLADLRTLQRDGYSLEQLRTFLSEIGITVSRQSIYDFLKRRQTANSHRAASVITQAAGEISEPKSVEQTSLGPSHGTAAEGTHQPDLRTRLQALAPQAVSSESYRIPHTKFEAGSNNDHKETKQ